MLDENRSGIEVAASAVDRAGSRVFPASSRLPVTSSWQTAVLVATGGSLMVIISLGAMAADLGNLSIWVWIVTAAIGGAQCLLIAELAGRFPERAGGTAQFAYRVRPGGSSTLGALSAWCYWFAWTPGIAVNLVLAGTCLRNVCLHSASPVLLALVIGTVLYSVTALGLKLSSVINAVLAVVAVAVVGVIVLGPVFKPRSFDLSQVLPTTMPSGSRAGFAHHVALVAKWTFVATWSSYAAEMASTVCAEIKRPERVMRRVMSVSAVICLAAFTAVPIALFGVVGAHGVQGDPFEVVARIGGVMLGPAGRIMLELGLAGVLILGAETFIIGSSRTIYQMARDGYLPAGFARTNKRGAPVGSIAWDVAVIGIMLLIFGTNVVSVVAAANFGYLIVFVLMPIAYLVLRKHPGGRLGSFRWGTPMAWLAVVLCVLNALILVAGGLQWGLPVVLIGIGSSLLILPISFVTRRLVVWRAAVALRRQPATL